MNRKLLGFICLFLISFTAKSQNAAIQGKIIDTATGKGIQNAVVMLLNEGDSLLSAFCRTDKNGAFSISGQKAGKRIVMITHPLFADYVDNITISEGKNDLRSIPITSKSKLLETIIVRTGGAIKIKGDTTIYTADSFNVSANANVEELLKKLPGIQVDKSGEIKAMGEKVEKVLVDGEEFFGDDPGMAVKNLRADAVKEVQVFDKKSEQAAFTGIDDGNTKKTINLKLKEDKKKGYFGKLSLAGGLAENVPGRFNNNLMFGSFKGKRKISAFVLNGNTNQDGLNWQESQKYSGDENNFEMTDEDGIFSVNFQSGATDDDIFINTENGFMRNINSGVHYSNKWNDKHKINLSPKYNLQDYSNNKTVLTQTQIGDSAFTETANTAQKVDRYNSKNSFIYDGQLDSANSVKVTLRGEYYHSESRDISDGQTLGTSGTLKNKSIRDNFRKSDKSVLSGNAIFKHKFSKARRTLSLNLDWNNKSNSRENTLISKNTLFYNAFTDSIELNQKTMGTQNSTNLSSRLVYTEPFNKKWSMELSYQLSLNNGDNDQKTFTRSTGNTYDIPVDSLTNDFKQKILIHTPGAKFNYAYKKFKVNFGSGFGITNFDLADQSRDTLYLRKYINVFPSASFVYSYKSNHSLRIRYNGSNTQPTIDQLQPLRNNSNIFNQYQGNPDLRPSFGHNVNITHNGYNFLKDMWNFQTVNVYFNENAITNNRIIDPVTGSTITRPINTSGNISLTSWTGMGFKVKKYDLNINLNANVNYSRFADVINDVVSFSNTTGGGLTTGVSKSKKEKYDISLSNSFSLNYNTNAQTKTANTFRTNNLTLNATVYYKKTWSIISDFEMIARQNLNNQNGNLNNQLLNIQIQKTFKNNEFTFYAKVRDLLNQNIGIDRNYYGNTFTEERNQRLRRYFLLGFTWDFKNKGTQK
ncbi:MAG: hypothetical protein RL582_185 [Bacteroidota bacterium]